MTQKPLEFPTKWFQCKNPERSNILQTATINKMLQLFYKFREYNAVVGKSVELLSDSN